MSFDFGNSLNWDLVIRSSYVSPTSPTGRALSIPPQSFLIDKRIIAVGVMSSSALPHWYIGAWISMRLLASPSSLSIFPATMEYQAGTAGLNHLTIFRLPEANLYPYMLVCKFPKSFKQADLEIWKYSGSETDSIMDALEKIELKLG